MNKQRRQKVNQCLHYAAAINAIIIIIIIIIYHHHHHYAAAIIIAAFAVNNNTQLLILEWFHYHHHQALAALRMLEKDKNHTCMKKTTFRKMPFAECIGEKDKIRHQDNSPKNIIKMEANKSALVSLHWYG